MTSVHRFSMSLRWLLWSPLPGIALLLWALHRAWCRRDVPALLVTVPMLLQLGAIFLFSITGEYRYLLPFFVLPVALLPIAADLRSRPQSTESVRHH